ncbi:MAG TPA: N-6 DNA methylase [Methylophilaceae bacterium]|jgi:adenine-specific DNA methylase
MNFKENESSTKLRGGYYTPPDIASFLARWILQDSPKSVLEPSCGDGSFIRAINGEAPHKMQFVGIELLEAEANKARSEVEFNDDIEANIINCDFLQWGLDRLDEGVTFDAVVGNPPYIRYQYLNEEDQKLSESIFKKYNLSFTKHTNAWVPFVIASVAMLKPGGKLGMVIPSELLHVLHAMSLRTYLLDQCSRILMIDPNELLFEDALQGTVLLMVQRKIDNCEPSQGVAVVAAPNNDFLKTDPQEIFFSAKYISGNVLNGKWMKVLLDKEELEVFERIRKLPSIKKFSEIAEVDVGIVTGANKFFLVDNDTVSKYELHEHAKPMFGRSGHCPGIIYSQDVHYGNAEKGMPTNFISIGKVAFDELNKGTQEYILTGEKEKIHTRYKCRIRKPWYSVPSVYVTELGMLKRAHNYPRLILNSAKAYTTDTAYRITSKVDPENLVYCFINSLTALTAEMEGRHYGGGVLEMVPSEIEKLLIPVVDVSDMDLFELDLKISQQHDPDELFKVQDSKILAASGLSDDDCRIIHQAWVHIRSRRQRLLGVIETVIEK